jgi:hypothetical protein
MDAIGASILVVEDDETLAMGLTSALEHEQFQVSHVDNGEAALSSVEDDPPDILVLDVAVMDAAWTHHDRRRVIDALFAALARGLGVDQPSPTWWIQFRVIEEGSWGSRGGVLSIVDLLGSGAFTPERADAILLAVQAG